MTLRKALSLPQASFKAEAAGDGSARSSTQQRSASQLLSAKPQLLPVSANTPLWSLPLEVEVEASGNVRSANDPAIRGVNQCATKPMGLRHTAKASSYVSLGGDDRSRPNSAPGIQRLPWVPSMMPWI
jgi:hypothetical protein